MLPKKFRLTVSYFNQIPEKAHDFNGIFLSAKIKSKKTGEPPQIAVIVPKRLDKRTSVRNRTKRIITETLRVELSNIKTQAFILLKAKKVVKKEVGQNIKKEMSFLLRKANLTQSMVQSED